MVRLVEEEIIADVVVLVLLAKTVVPDGFVVLIVTDINRQRGFAGNFAVLDVARLDMEFGS